MCGHGAQAKHKLAMLNTAHTYLGCWGQMWAPQYRRVVDILEQVQQRATKMMMGLQHPQPEKSLRAGPARPGIGKLMETCTSYLTLSMCISTPAWVKTVQQAEPGSSQWYPDSTQEDKRKQAQTKI